MIGDSVKQIQSLLECYDEAVNININYSGHLTLSYRGIVKDTHLELKGFENTLAMLEWMDSNLTKVQ